MKKVWSYLSLLYFVCFLIQTPSGLALAGSGLGLKEGYESFLKRDYAQALSFLQGLSIPKGHPLRDYYLYSLGRSQLETGDNASALKNLNLLIEEEPYSIWHSVGQIAKARVLVAQSEFAKAQAAISAILDTLSGDLKGEALYVLGLAELGLGTREAGIDHLKQSYFRFPNSNLEPLLLAKFKELGVSTTASSQDSLDRVYKLLENKNYSKALDASVELVNLGDGSISAQAKALRGEALYNLKRYGDAALYLTGAGPGLPQEWARHALLDLGMSQFRNGDEALGKQTLSMVQERYPGTAEGEEALYRIGMIDHQAQRFAEAQASFEKLAQAYPHGNFRDKALWAATWAAYRRADFPAAMTMAKLMEQGASDAPTLGKALYWKGRILEKQENLPQAQEAWKQAAASSPFSYYGVMALKRLKGSTDLAETPPMPEEWKNSAAPVSTGSGKASQPNKDKKANPVSLAWDLHFRKALALFENGLGKVVNNELDAAISQNAGSTENLMKLLEASQKTNAYFIPVLFGQKYWDKFKGMFPDNRSAEDYRARLMYPFAYRAEVEKAGQEFALSPHFVVALMRQESGFMPWVISSANAQGLMQLLSATAASRARAAGISGYDLLNPEDNIRLGTAELSAMVTKFSNNWVLAIAAYNAGPGRSNEWSGQFGNLPQDEFVEEIPFSETNLYVKLVLRNYWAYKMLHP